MTWKNFASRERACPPLAPTTRIRELIIGVSVKLTSKETRMAMAIVQPKELT